MYHRRPHPDAFRPPHCPNRSCSFHTPHPAWHYHRDGFFSRKNSSEPFQRFRCLHCNRRFSTRTFAADYWLRYRSLLPRIAQLSVEGPGIRQTARLLHVSHTTVLRHLARAGRHCMLFHLHLLRCHPVAEPIVFDGFESFEYSQFFPFHLNLAVGQHSWFLWRFTDSPLRRKGRMTPSQRSRRLQLEEMLGRPDPKAIEKAIVTLLEPLLPKRPQAPILLRSDDHPAYPRALRRLPCFSRLAHRTTSSTVRRTTSNPLFPVNLADLLLRHGQANHRRETIAFSKRRQGALERLAVFTVWRNTIKRRREKRAEETAAMVAGVCSKPIRWEEVFDRRRFPRQEEMPEPWWSYYLRKVKTQALGDRQAEHALLYAF